MPFRCTLTPQHKLEGESEVGVTRQSMSNGGMGKRKLESMKAGPKVEEEMASNTKKKGVVTTEKLRVMVSRFNQAVIEDSSTLPVFAADDFVAAAKESRKWHKAGKIKYLLEVYKWDAAGVAVPADTITKARVQSKEGDPVGYKSLVVLLRECWEVLGTEVSELESIEGIMHAYKDYK